MSTIKRSVNKLELFDGQRRKGPGSLDFALRIKAMTIVAKNSSSFIRPRSNNNFGTDYGAESKFATHKELASLTF